MNYQKTSTGLRIGASMGFMILMLGIAIAISVYATLSINNNLETLTSFNVPLEKSAVQISSIQDAQDNELTKAVRFLQSGDRQSVQITQDEFYFYNDRMNEQLRQAKDLVNSWQGRLPSGYPNAGKDAFSAQIDSIARLHSQYQQSANEIFDFHDGDGWSRLVALENNLKAEEQSLGTKQQDLLTSTDGFYQNIELSANASTQRFLTLEVVIMASAGIISLTSSHFVNQINKDLVREVAKKTDPLLRANEKLQKMNMIKDEFLNEASHELKSPLSPIYGFVELAMCGDMDKEEALQGIAKQARQIEEVANKILDLGKIDNNKLKLSFERFDLNRVISEITATARVNLEENVSMVADLNGSIFVEADRVRIGQVVRNMVNNAVKFTSSGTIVIMSSSNGSSAKVAVKDTGSGIHSDVLPKIFEKFVTKNLKGENLEGSGLGLYICKGIIEAHGGGVSAFNNRDCGATVSFSIPLTPSKRTDCSVTGSSQIDVRTTWTN